VESPGQSLNFVDLGDLLDGDPDTVK
jgi:hypothetical protein